MEKYDPATIKKLIDTSLYSLKDEWGKDSMSALAAANTAIAMMKFNEKIDYGEYLNSVLEGFKLTEEEKNK